MTERAILRWYLLHVVPDLLSYRALADFHAWHNAWEQKDKIRDVTRDERTHFRRLSQKLREIADNLTFEDLDPAAEIPETFAEYKRIRNWSGKI